MATPLRCSLRLHHWTKASGGPTLTCARCKQTRPVGKMLRCRIGIHRWMGVRRDGGEPFRECFYCLKYGGSPQFHGGESGA
ncbi:MAG TPA: hypothetical protein VFJ78_06070 [Gaiellaceae bacterium]|nr:hypothetical protein [Gaiellaceae bacterium]